VCLGGIAGETNDGTGSTVVPVWCEETGEGSDEVDTTGVLDAGSEVANFRSILNQADRIAEPLDGATGDSDGSLKRILRSGLGVWLVCNLCFKKRRACQWDA
jgi:hypothetical protein